MTTTPRASASDGVKAGVTIGDYTLLAKIGEGGMGIVHLARRPGGERVALKVLRPHIVGDDEARHRLAREVSSLSRIRSRWVAEIVDSDPWAPIPYVATRYVPGLSLHDHVVEEGPILGADLVWFASCLAEGVASVHAAGVLHRDVKPSNVLMEGRTPILIDFGLARVADDPKLTHTGWLLGTPGYLAPEILYGDDATTASDVHSWASTVVFAATGSPPFGRGPSMAIMDRVRRGEHDLSGVPGALRPLLAAALDPDPTRRPTIPEIIARLRRLAEGGPAEGAAADQEPTDRFPSSSPAGAQTLPVGYVAAQAASRPTDVHSDLRPPPPPPTRLLTQLGGPLGRPLGRTWRDDDRSGAASDELDTTDPWEPQAPQRVGFTEKVRRATLLLGVVGLAGVATAVVPWWTLAVVVVLVWLLRSGSLAASAAGERRRVRGRSWYDAPLVLVRAPWDLVRSLPGTLLLILWSAGLAVSAALLCYAAATSEPIALGVVGAAFALSLWTGPGSSRVRSPIARVVHPLARGWRGWLVAVVVVLAVLAGLGLVLVQSGSSWSPGGNEPLSNIFAG